MEEVDEDTGDDWQEHGILTRRSLRFSARPIFVRPNFVLVFVLSTAIGMTSRGRQDSEYSSIVVALFPRKNREIEKGILKCLPSRNDCLPG